MTAPAPRPAPGPSPHPLPHPPPPPVHEDLFDPGPHADPDVVPAPGAHEVHLWWLPVGPWARWEHVLDDAERAAAARFAVPGARDVHVTSRVAQRALAARYGVAPAAQARFTRDCVHCGAGHGAPRLVGAGWRYSVSHTRAWVAVAVAGRGPVGLDLEDLTAVRDVEALARTVLTPHERAATAPQGGHADAAAAGEAGHVRRFARVWTRKEAALKLTGHGLGVDPAHVHVLGPTAQVDPVPAGWPGHAVHLHDLDARAGHVCALATAHAPVQVVPCGTPLSR